ncbi:MAG: glycosyltransferase [Desulfobacteraceae bacterium]|nr:MAG: glycosyltransferase [Desulfobacteraceae bacterium]
MSRRPKVSIFLWSYNHAKYLREAIDCVLHQIFSDFELFILDDASTDESLEIIYSYSDPRIQVFKNITNQLGEFPEVFPQAATGEYIAIHHSDDVWEFDKLEKQVAFLDAHPEVGAAFTNVMIIGEQGESLKDKSHPYYNIFKQPNRNRHEWLNFFFHHGNALCHPSVLIRKVCYENCGLYRYGLFQLPDFDMWIRLCLKYEIFILPDQLVRFRVHENEETTSGNKPEKRIRLKYEFYKTLENYKKIESFCDLVKVFPTAEKYNRGNETDIQFVLAMVALEEASSASKQLFGLDILLELISNPIRSATIQKLYNFDHRVFIDLTAKYDIFSTEKIPNLLHIITERDKQIKLLNQGICDLDSQIAVLNQELQALTELKTAFPLFMRMFTKRFLKTIHQLRYTSGYLIKGDFVGLIRRISETQQVSFSRLEPILSDIKRHGGFSKSIQEALQLFRQDGMSGIWDGVMRILSRHQRLKPHYHIPILLKPISTPAEELLELRVLIIAELSLPLCTKYRVMQKKAMFEKLGVECTVISWTDRVACHNALSTHSLVIFYRVSGFDCVLELISEAHRLKMPTFWEVDDLIFNRALLEQSKSLAAIGKTVFEGMLNGAGLYLKAMLACGKGIASSTGLALEMESAGSGEVIVIENALDQETLDYAKQINATKRTAAGGFVRIVYGSGTNTHNVDFEEVADAILQILKHFDNVKFRLIGPLDLPKKFIPYESKIEKIPLCDYKQYLSLLAECDISIAPLENTVFNDAKSNIKFLEASIVKIPSVCSPRATFRQAIAHGENGFLCETQDAFKDVLEMLVKDPGMRKRVGESAYTSVIEDYSPDGIANHQVLPLVKKYKRTKHRQRILSVNIYNAPQSFAGDTMVAEAVNKLSNNKEPNEIYIFTTLPEDMAPAYKVRRYETDNGVCVFGMGVPAKVDTKAQFVSPQALEAFESVLSAVQPDWVHLHCAQGLRTCITDLCAARGIRYTQYPVSGQ